MPTLWEQQVNFAKADHFKDLTDSFVVRIVYDYDSLYCEALSSLDFYEKPSSGYFSLNILSYFLYYSIL